MLFYNQNSFSQISSIMIKNVLFQNQVLKAVFSFMSEIKQFSTMFNSYNSSYNRLWQKSQNYILSYFHKYELNYTYAHHLKMIPLYIFETGCAVKSLMQKHKAPIKMYL